MLVRWSKRPKAPHSIAQRARIVLLAADGLSNNEVADKVGCNQATVVKWRKRFIERGLDGLPDDPRPGAPRSISDDDVEAVIVRTLEDKPTDATHWSTRDLAAKLGISASSVGGNHCRSVAKSRRSWVGRRCVGVPPPTYNESTWYGRSIQESSIWMASR